MAFKAPLARSGISVYIIVRAFTFFIIHDLDPIRSDSMTKRLVLISSYLGRCREHGKRWITISTRFDLFTFGSVGRFSIREILWKVSLLFAQVFAVFWVVMDLSHYFLSPADCFLWFMLCFC